MPLPASNSTFILARVWDGKEWTTYRSAVRVRIHFGTAFGMLEFRFKCDCCDHAVVVPFFFSKTETDVILSECCMTTTPGEQAIAVKMRLPSGELATFTYEGSSPELNTLVTRALVEANEAKEEEASLVVLFGTLKRRIDLRTMFRRLYFRAFRRAFAPGGAAATRSSKELQEELGCVMETA